MAARPPRVVLLALAVLAVALAAPAARAAPVLRHQELVNGDFTIIGNTLAHDCDTGTVLPTVGTVGACGANSGDSGADVFWRSNPGAGTAAANNTITLASSQSSAMLDAVSIPTAATVTYARLYWAATMGATNAYGASATLTTPDSVAHAVTADPAASRVIYTGSATYGYWYQSSADVTSLVQARGRYTVSGVTAQNLVDLNSNVAFDAWWIVVFYTDPGETALRQLTLFDGLDYVQSGAPADVTLGGFLVPNGGWDAKLGVVAYEGDGSITGDALSFQGYKSTGAEPTTLTVLSDAQNPANDFFNRTRSWLGAARSVAGDLPRYSGVDGSMQGVDLDVVDLKAIAGAIHGGDDSAKIRASSTGDVFALGAFITSINTLKPSFLKTVKTATNITVPDRGDGTIFAGDLIEYVISTQNTGNDPSIQTVIQDPLPVGVTYVPGSLELLQGGSWIGLTDAEGDDVADYLTTTRTVVVRIGTGANAWVGGTVAIGAGAKVRFHVTVNPGAAGVIQNRATVAAAGQAGEPVRSFDSNPPFGTGPTDVPVDQCLADVHCGGATPACDVTPTPNVCVACTNDSYCGGATPVCDLATRACVPRVTLTSATPDRTTVAGTAAPFAETVTSYFGAADTFDLDVVPGLACTGWGVAIRTAGGALVGTRSGGAWTIPAPATYDTDGDGYPDLGPTAGPGETSFVVWLTPPGGTAAGTTCDAVVVATGHAPGSVATAAIALHVGAPATWTPDYSGATTKIVPRGADVSFPGVLQNNTSAPLTFALTNTVSPSPGGQGTLQAVTFYSDPDGDGDPADGVVITSAGPVSGFGGRLHVVAVVHTVNTVGTALSIGTDLTSTSTATSGAVTATQTALAQIQYAAPYSNAARTLVATAFTPCDTVYVGATMLPTGYPFALEWYAKASPVRGTDTPFRTVDPWPVSGGAGTDQLQLPATAVGTWTVLVVQKQATPAVIDTITFQVERGGTFTSLLGPARVAPGGALSVTAALASGNASAIFDATQIAYTVTGGGQYMDGAGAFSAAPGTTHLTAPVAVAPGATASDAWLVSGPAWPGPGTYQLDGAWQVQCGGVTQVIAQATPFTFVVAPAAPAITTPAGGALLSTRTPTFSGTATAAASVTVTVGAGAATCGPVVATGSGTWTCPLGTSLADGTWTATAVQIVGGATSDASAAVSFTVDATPPAIALDVPVAGALLGAAAAPGGVVSFSGTAEPGAPVVVSAGAATANATRSGGSWAATLTLADGIHTATATATDAAGNAGTAQVTFTLDTTPPGAPLLTPVPDPTRADPIVVAGTAESGATAELFLDGVSQGTRLAGPSFSFSLAGVPSGPHGVYAVARDPAGNTSVPSATAAFLVDRTAPGLASVEAPADGAVLDAAAAPGGTVDFSGTSENGSTVEVEVDGVVLGIAGAPGGTWAAAYTVGQGLHQVRVRATDGAGNVGAWSASSGFTVDSVAPLAPVLDPPASPTSAAIVTVTGTVADVTATVGVYVDGAFAGTATGSGGFSLELTLAEGTYAIRARALDGAGNASPLSAPVPLTIDRTPPAAPGLDPLVTPTNATRVTVTGATDAGTTVTVYLDGTSVGTAAESGGRFSLAVDLAEGSFTFTARATDDAANASGTSNAVPVVVDRTAPAAPGLDPMATPTNAVTLTVAGTTGAGTTVTVYRDGTPVGTATESGGRFSLELAVAEGTFTFTGTAADAAGNASGPSAGRTVVVDRTPPAPPALDPLLTPTNAASVTVTGTADAGTTVTIFRGGVAVATVPVTGGRFSASVAVFAGTVSFTASATDAAGNTSPRSGAVEVLVDHTAPAVPVLDPLVTPTNATSAVATGLADAGSTVTLLLGGVPAGLAVAAADGTFSIPVGLSDGANVLTAHAADAAGNVSADSAPIRVDVDRIAPDAPVLAALDSPTGASTVSVAGSAEAGSAVTVYRDGVAVGTVTATGGTFLLDVPVAEGPHTFVAAAADAAGNVSADSNAVAVVVDHTLPAPPVLAALVSPTHATTLAVSGTAEAGSTVTVLLDGTPVGTVAAPGGAFTLVVAVPEGDLSFTATSRDAVGNLSAASNVVLVTVDRTPPATPDLVAPAAGAFLGEASAPGGLVTFVGTTDVGTSLELDVDSATSTLSGATGTWAASRLLGEGPHQVRIRAVDAAGNASPWTPQRPFTVDTVPPPPPHLDPLPASTTATAVTVTGSAEAGALVTLQEASWVGTVTAGSDGRFAVVVPLAEGWHGFVGYAADAAGNVSPYSNGATVTVDRTAPPAPALDPLVTPTNASTVTVRGTAEAGATVTVLRDGTPVGTAVATGGAFSLPVSPGEGSAVFTATATDAAGNVSPLSPPVSILVDRTAPAAPLVAAVTTPTRADPVGVSGTAEAGATVELFLDGVSQGTRVAGPAFAFSLAGVAPGAHAVTAVARDPAGNLSPASLPVTFTVDRIAPGLATVDGPADGALLGAAAALAGEVPFSGTSEAGSTVEVEVDGVVLGIAGAPGGTWSAAHTLLDGAHQVRVRATDTAGNAGAWSAASAFTLDTAAPAAPALDAPATPTSSAAVTVTGAAEPGAVVSVLLDGAFAGTVVAAGDGRFDLAVPVSGEGAHAFTASATDAAGNTSTASSAAAVIVDRTAPAAPTLDPLVTPTNAATVPVGGHAEAGATVTVLVDGVVAGTTVAAGDGSWSVPVPVGDGGHTVTAVATDPAGNASGASADAPVTVDTHGPAAPSFTHPTAGATLPPGPVLLEGTAEAGATVRVVVDGTTYTTVAAGDGRFSVTTAALPAGSFTATATAADAASNVSAPASVTFATRAGSADGHVVGGGCGCTQGGGSPVSALLLVAFALVLAPRRRARAEAR